MSFLLFLQRCCNTLVHEVTLCFTIISVKLNVDLLTHEEKQSCTVEPFFIVAGRTCSMCCVSNKYMSQSLAQYYTILIIMCTFAG